MKDYRQQKNTLGFLAIALSVVLASTAQAGATDTVWASYLGGSAIDYGYGVAVDSTGDTLVTGVTYSPDFPIRNAAQQTIGGDDRDAFVAKIRRDGQLAWATYLGGPGEDGGFGIAVDPSGNALIVGAAGMPSFPTPQGNHTVLGDADVFVAKFTSSGALSWVNCFGGSERDHGYGIALDSTGNAWVTGDTASSDFPTPGGFQASLADPSNTDAFVARIAPDGSLAWASCLGGSGATDVGRAVATDASGNVWVGGYTGASDFPVPGGFQTDYHGRGDAFVARVTPWGALAWASYLGGSMRDECWGIATDRFGNAWATGYVESPDFPTVNPFQPSLGGGGYYDAFAARITPSGTLGWASYLGGDGEDRGFGVAIDSSDNAWVVGYSWSSDFPTPGGFQMTQRGPEDGFVARITPTGTLAWGTYLGGGGEDEALALSVGRNGSVFVTGITRSPDFPAPFGFDGTYGGGGADAYIARIGNEKTYYVNDSSTTNDNWCTAVGNDSNDGLTPATPKATVQAIIGAYDLGPGDTVCIDTGTYNLTSDILIESSDEGSAEAPVSFVASPYGVTIDRGMADPSAVWRVGAKYITLTTAESARYPSVAQSFTKITGGGCGVDIDGEGCCISRCDVCNNSQSGIVVSQPAVVENCIVRGSTNSGGTGIWIDLLCPSIVRNCTIYGNKTYQLFIDATLSGPPVFPAANCVVKNNIMWGDGFVCDVVYANSAQWGYFDWDYNDLYATNGASIGYPGSGAHPLATLAEWQAATGKDAHSVSVNPLFADAAGGDFHLKSLAGRYSPATGLPPEVLAAWANDTASSPCIDAGNPASDYASEPIPNGRRVNMGAYGNTEQASRSDLFVVTTSLQGVAPGVPYSKTLVARGGLPPYAWSIASGDLPPGLTLNSVSGIISGTPTTVGVFDFTARVTDSQSPGDSADKALHIIVSVGPTYYFIKSDNEQSTTNTNYVGKVTLDFSPPAADDWLIFAFCEFKCSNANYATFVQLFIDSTGEGQNTRKPVDPSDCMPFIALKEMRLGAGSHRVQLMYRAGNSAAAAYIRNARICAVRRAALEYWNVANDNAKALTINLQEVTSLSWTPAAAGNYLVISTAELNATTTVSTDLQTICDEVLNDEGVMRAADNGDYTTFMSFNYCANAPAGVPITHKIAGRKMASSSTNHYIRRARILALRLSQGRFNNTAAGYATEKTTTQTTWQEALATSWTYGVDGNWLFLNSARVLNTSTSYQTEVRVQLNNAATCAQQLMKPKDSTDLLNFSSIDIRNLTTPRQVDMDFRTTSVAGTAKVRRLRFYGLPLDAQ